MEFTTFDSIQIGLASPEQILKWSYGMVEKPETINYRTQKPERGGLFCEKIFGPTKDWECYCGKFKKVRFKGQVCPQCGVEITRAKVRRERMGHIQLAAPVAHIWYFKGTPACIRQVLGDLSQKDLEAVIYFTRYVVTDPGEPDPVRGGYISGLAKQQVMTEEEYNAAQQQMPGQFKAEMGAGAILHLLQEFSQDRYDKFRDHLIAEGKLTLEPDEMDACRSCELGHNCRECSFCAAAEDEEWRNNLDMTCEELKEEVKKLDEKKPTHTVSQKSQKRSKLLKRLEILEAFRQSGNRPEWMVMTILPVIPPDIRPMVMLDGGRYATSDLNDLYRRVINRNNRLQKMLEMNAPSIIIRNEARMLQEAVDALIDNGRHGKDVTGPNNRKLKSLSDILKGKQGRFRQNLLGKRVDYSGRSVIVVGPELKMYQCGLPKEMALELFKPFVLKRLVDIGKLQNIKSARKRVDTPDDDVWDALEHVIKDHPVLLNRAPTLHRLGIQAFEPVLVEGRALKLHPLVCTAFNADFDGDQMAVHLPLSAEAQAEARFLMLAANNLLKPSDGKPVAVPTQDMILGSYYLTMVKEGEPGEGKVFRDVDEAMMAYNEHYITLHSKIRVRITKEGANGVKASRIIDCTVGRLIFNEIIPQDLGFIDRSVPENAFELEIQQVVKKGVLSKIIDKCIKVHGVTDTAEVLDKIKALGYKFSTRSGLTVAVIDAVIPPQKADILAAAEAKVSELNEQYQYGYISDEVRYEQVCGIWKVATDEVTKALEENLDPFNPINIMADSGARGSINQIRQLAGMRGLIANTSGATIEIPVRSNYREGLNISEYFISSRGARKGLADTALRTADSGYLTRRLVDVSQDVIIREIDCGSTEGIEVYTINDGQRDQETLEERLIGRYLVEDLRDEAHELFIPKTRAMTAADAEKIVKAGFTRVTIRSVLGCKAKKGVCAKCYGINLANGNLVSVGEAVGIIAAQSIGEPGTQLTMRTFHTGGIANAEDITQGLPRVEELFEARRPKNGAILAKTSGVIDISEKDGQKIIVITDPDTGEVSAPYTIPYNYHLAAISVNSGKPRPLQSGDKVKRGSRLTANSIYPLDLLEILGVQAVENYIIEEIQYAYRQQGVSINDKHIEVIVRQMMRKVTIADPGSSYLLPESMVDKRKVEEINAGIQARMDAGETGLSLVTTRPTLLGITKASSFSESFMSAASFQETAKALTDAAINGKCDKLHGLKENVIIGKLIPAGTGMTQYGDVEVIRADSYPTEAAPTQFS